MPDGGYISVQAGEAKAINSTQFFDPIPPGSPSLHYLFPAWRSFIDLLEQPFLITGYSSFRAFLRVHDPEKIWLKNIFYFFLFVICPYISP
jgi:hypothetical protein